MAAPYVPGYTNVEPTSPDTSYEFGLRAGKDVPEGTAVWYLARLFEAPEDGSVTIALDRHHREG